jgi:hypothetical protein
MANRKMRILALFFAAVLVALPAAADDGGVLGFWNTFYQQIVALFTNSDDAEYLPGIPTGGGANANAAAPADDSEFVHNVPVGG